MSSLCLLFYFMLILMFDFFFQSSAFLTAVIFYSDVPVLHIQIKFS